MPQISEIDPLIQLVGSESTQLLQAPCLFNKNYCKFCNQDNKISGLLQQITYGFPGDNQETTPQRVENMESSILSQVLDKLYLYLKSRLCILQLHTQPKIRAK